MGNVSSSLSTPLQNPQAGLPTALQTLLLQEALWEGASGAALAEPLSEQLAERLGVILLNITVDHEIKNLIMPISPESLPQDGQLQEGPPSYRDDWVSTSPVQGAWGRGRQPTRLLP